MKKLIALVLLVSVVCSIAQEAPPPPPVSAPAVPAVAAPDAQLLDSAWLSQVVLHLYRWYMDETDVDDLVGIENFTFWVKPLEVKTDPDDDSRYAEIILPLVGFQTRVKKADYTVEELGVDIQSDGYRIVSVSRIPVPETMPPDCTLVEIDYQQMREYLFRMRDQAQYPDEEMRNYLRPALMHHLGLNPAQRQAGEQIIHMAPLSPVANELWVFWENGKMLFHFASDIDLENPKMWEHQTLGIRTYDIEKQTVVSLNEVPGSNEFMTRDQVGRALYNCIIIGQRLSTVNPSVDPAGNEANKTKSLMRQLAEKKAANAQAVAETAAPVATE